ncbi:MAG: T9SS type A sorting domain-containing protein, partial [Crocinitomicaceae bacterium]
YDSLGAVLDFNLTHYAQDGEQPRSMVQHPITKDYYMTVQLYDRTPLNSTDPIFDKRFCLLRIDENLNVIGRLNLSGINAANNINVCDLTVIDNDLFMTGRMHASSWITWTSIGQPNYLYPEDDKMILAKLSLDLNLDWHRSIPHTYFANTIFGPFAHEGNLLYWGVNGDFSTDGNTFTTYGTSDCYLLDITDNDSTNISISGSVFRDVDQDGLRTAVDDTVAYQELSATSSILNSYLTNADGEFSFSGTLGSQMIYSESIPTYWARSTPDSIEVNPLVSDTIIEDVNFGIYPTPGIQDLTANILPLTAARPGFDAEYLIEVCNVGTETASGSFYFVQSPSLTYISSTTPPTSISGDTLFFDYTNLEILDCIQVKVLDSVANDLSLFGGNLLQKAHVMPVVNDTTPANNTDHLLHPVTGAYDPNDISVYPSCDVTEDFVQNDLRLDYLIRFQNTGTDTAFTVLLKDSLSEHFDFSSFVFNGSSHDAEISIEDSVLLVQFDNILLTDSSTNLVESKGYFSYSIQLLPTTSIGSSVNNTAAIFFDYNPPIITNTVTTNVLNSDSLVQLTSSDANPCGEGGTISYNALCSEYGLWVALDNEPFTFNETGVIDSVDAGNHFVKITNGFDTLGPLPVTVNYNPISSASSINICQGDSILIGSAFQSVPGVYTDTLSAVNGCDSLLVTTLIADPIPMGIQALSICEGDSLFLFNEYQSMEDVYYDTIASSLGCDSVVLTDLSYYYNPNGSQALTICQGDSIFVFDEYISLSGVYSDTVQGANGCDSIVVTTISQYAVSNIGDQFLSICSGDSIFVFDEYQSAAGIYYDTIQSASGCDSIVKTDLHISLVGSNNQSFTICSGDSVFVIDEYQNSAGTYFDTLQSVNGCDSLVISTIVNSNMLTIGVVNNNGVLEADVSGLGYQWIDCANNANVPGATMQLFEPTSTGSYAVVVFDGDCYDTSSCETVIVGNVETLNQNLLITLHPNPTASMIEITTSIQTSETAFIVDNLGRIVMEIKLTGETTIVDVSKLSSGVYSFHVLGMHRSFMKKD